MHLTAAAVGPTQGYGEFAAEYAAFAAALRGDNLPSHVAAAARINLLDTLACATAGLTAPGVADVISSRVGISAEKGDPLGQMKLSSRAKAQAVQRDATALLTACGLALRSFD